MRSEYVWKPLIVPNRRSSGNAPTNAAVTNPARLSVSATVGTARSIRMPLWREPCPGGLRPVMMVA
jgi:hypothetical protein